MSNDEKTLSRDLSASKDPPVFLAIETATRAGSVAVSRGGEILASTSGDASSSHSTDLIENIDLVLRESEVQLSDVELFAAAVGPGSFTGLRIGLATVKSLAVALNRKCAGVSTLGAIAFAAGESECTVALLPAGRGEVFAQMFSVRDGDVSALDEAAHISPQALIAKYGKHATMIWAGEGAHAQLEMLRHVAEERAIEFTVNKDAVARGWLVAPENNRIAESVAKLAFLDYRSGNTVAPGDLRANYVRPSDAEIKVHA